MIIIVNIMKNNSSLYSTTCGLALSFLHNKRSPFEVKSNYNKFQQDF